ncbi:hypothetical protein [Paraburkholderia sp. MM5384-R2]|uniref:hypothetical protein n=1 Tax=Paraburkholderia sp. MM5384-R2 TaxID=2723097 RepID=UPI0017A96C7B|nr:hypothetical protein [Paraburkholderia sp. MM5384-R2]MBB5501524.1 hypothetical protein [Paraburkholderia sp. MM5384-R2]
MNAIGGAATTASAFAFALAGEVRSGAFYYFLFRGGLNGSNPQDWFLRSSFEVAPENGNGNGNGGNGNGGKGNGRNGGNGGNGNGAGTLPEEEIGDRHSFTARPPATRHMAHHWTGARHLWSRAADRAAAGPGNARHAA